MNTLLKNCPRGTTYRCIYASEFTKFARLSPFTPNCLPVQTSAFNMVTEHRDGFVELIEEAVSKVPSLLLLLSAVFNALSTDFFEIMYFTQTRRLIERRVCQRRALMIDLFHRCIMIIVYTNLEDNNLQTLISTESLKCKAGDWKPVRVFRSYFTCQ